jgi:hypothetical protein
LRFLLDQPLIPPDFDQTTIDSVWNVWPIPLREVAKNASLEERREMIFRRYGLTPRPDDPTKPLQYVVDQQGQWTMNCCACHQGSAYGVHVLGVPNTEFDLQTLTEETRKIKLLHGKPMGRMDVGSLLVPLNGSRGVSNAVMFGVALMNFRDERLNVVEPKGPPRMVHHDMDAPPWWNYHLRDHIYIDGFAERSHRSLMQFALVRENGPEWFSKNEDAFRDVDAFLRSLRPPSYPSNVDAVLAMQGEKLFDRHCAECHGHYGDQPSYPGKGVPIDQIGTDRVRFSALTASDRRSYGTSWFAHYGREATLEEPVGYVAPPLLGIWATAPYFHNGSVPTLWHVMHPDERPKLWKRTSQQFDSEKVGLTIAEVAKIPFTELDISVRRSYFDTSRFGKSAAGHEYPNALDEREKVAVLEYLKTL